MLDHSEPVDDFEDLPTLEVGAGMELTPSVEQQRAGRMREVLEKANNKALTLGKGRQITTLANQGLSAPAIADKTGLTPAEVRETTSALAELAPEEQKQLGRFTLPKVSVFDLYDRIQELYDDLKSTMKFMDDAEVKLGYFAELRQLFKLAKDVLQDVTFKKQQEQEREEEIQLILSHLEDLEPAKATALFKAIREHRERRKILGGK